MKFDGANHVGGRPPGAKNKLQRDFLEALAKDFADHGEAAIKIVRIEQPDVYLKVVASLMPKELEVEHSQLGDMSDDEVNALLEYVQIERAKLIEHKPRMIEAPGKAPAIADKKRPKAYRRATAVG
jgi:hypothetical protein